VNNVQGLPSNSQVKLYLTNSSVQYSVDGVAQPAVGVPNAVVTLNSSSQSGAKTVFDLTNNRWSTNVAKTALTGNTFVTGVAVPVPAGGFPNGIQNVTFSASFSTDTPGVTLQWQWGAAVYTSLSTIYATSTNANLLGVNRAKTRGEREGRMVPFCAAWDPTSEPAEPAVDPAMFNSEDSAWPGHWAAPPRNWAADPEQALLSRELKAQTEAAIDRLPASQGEVITLRDVQGFTSEEVCSLLGVSEANQRVLLHRARSRVRQALACYLESTPPNTRPAGVAFERP